MNFLKGIFNISPTVIWLLICSLLGYKYLTTKNELLAVSYNFDRFVAAVEQEQLRYKSEVLNLANRLKDAYLNLNEEVEPVVVERERIVKEFVPTQGLGLSKEGVTALNNMQEIER